MTITLELPDDLAARLEAQARAHGYDLNGFAVAALARVAEDGKTPRFVYTE